MISAVKPDEPASNFQQRDTTIVLWPTAPPAGEAQCILADAVRSSSRADKLIVAKPGPRRQPWSADNGGNCSVLQKTIISLGAVATIVETTYFAPLLRPLKCPRLSAIRTRWEIVRACIFCMTAAL
jgi:hypothetical protein